MLRRLIISLFLAISVAGPPAAFAQNVPTAASTARATTGPNTLAELKSRIDEIVRQPALEPGFFAVKIVSLDTGYVIFEKNAKKFVRPASNMKLYTFAAEFDRLQPNYHFITSIHP